MKTKTKLDPKMQRAVKLFTDAKRTERTDEGVRRHGGRPTFKAAFKRGAWFDVSEFNA
jgi:hypothetical protein